MKHIEKVEYKEERIMTETEGDGFTSGQAILLKGEIHYSSFSYPERVAKYREAFEGINQDNPSLQDEMTLVSRYYEILKSKIEKVDLVTDKGQQITSIEDLYEYQEGVIVGNNLALKLLTGNRLGNEK